MRIQIYKALYNYLVKIGNDYYEMSDNADMPNEVCQYMGDDVEIDERYQIMDYMPVGIVRKTIKIILLAPDIAE